ncbi:MAG: hypothetical protein ACO1OG_08020 [Devosia sp.]
MAKLALAIGEGSQIGADWASVRVATRTGREAYRALGSPVALYRLLAQKQLSFVGIGRMEGVSFVSPELQECSVIEYRPLPAPVAGTPDEASTPGVSRYLPITDERFDELLREVRPNVPALGIAEVGATFEVARPLDSFPEVRTEVFRRWDFRCAITDTQFSENDTVGLRVVPIRPRESGGMMVPENYLPLVEIAEHAWRSGVIGVTDSMDIVGVLNRLDPDLLGAMPKDGKLILPSDPAHAPSMASLVWHWTHVFKKS